MTSNARNVLTWAVMMLASALAAEPSLDVAQLADEVRTRGWIVFPARSDHGDWDLFLMRPDGSQRRNFTESPEWNEAAPQFSRDGTQLLYRRLKRSEKIEGNRYGEQGALVVVNSNGGNERVMGGEGQFPWASWSPDGREFATLSIKGVAFVDSLTGQTRRSFPRNGLFQQLTWSPDGKWLVGVANSFGTGWSIARMNAETGEVTPVNTGDCCTPDWFPEAQSIIFSWRAPGQKDNRGIGWTQLWRADADGKNRQLIFGEDGRHIYGGHISPDGKYALFTGNPEEDGDPQHTGAPMGLVRLSDTPIIGGSSRELRAHHPDAKSGPVLALPSGWEPCWTYNENWEPPLSLNSLSTDLQEKGWIAFTAQTPHGDWDLFLMRPDGSQRHQLTTTPDYNEAGVRFSPDGSRILYYRMAKTNGVDNNTYGTFDLVLADANGSDPVIFGPNFPWACWGPDGREIACLFPSGIQIIDVASRKAVRTVPRQGIVQQLGWSPDGKSFSGTANGLGQFWNIGWLSASEGKIASVSETDRYNCTPDWCPDSQHIIYSRGIIPKEGGGRAELWIASEDGREKKMLYAEEGRHIYGACAAPDAKYLLFTRSVEDLGAVGKSQTTIAVIRWADTPMIGDDSVTLRKQYPNAKPARRLDLGPGWEPHWTYSEAPAKP